MTTDADNPTPPAASKARRPRAAKKVETSELHADLIGTPVRYTPKADELETLKAIHGVKHGVLAGVVTDVDGDVVSLRVFLPAGGEFVCHGVREGEGPHTFATCDSIPF